MKMLTLVKGNKTRGRQGEASLGFGIAILTVYVAMQISKNINHDLEIFGRIVRTNFDAALKKGASIESAIESAIKSEEIMAAFPFPARVLDEAVKTSLANFKNH